MTLRDSRAAPVKVVKVAGWWGQAANAVVVAAALALASAIGEYDFTPLPDWMETIVVPAAAVAVGAITQWAMSRRAHRGVADPTR